MEKSSEACVLLARLALAVTLPVTPSIQCLLQSIVMLRIGHDEAVTNVYLAHQQAGFCHMRGEPQ